MKFFQLFRRGRNPKPLTFEEKFSRDGDFFGSREKKQPPRYGKLPLVMICFVGGVVLCLAVLLLTGFWRVGQVTAHDGEHYSAARVLECSGVEVGDGMLSFDRYSLRRTLKEALPLIDNVKVRRHFNGDVSISFSEFTNLYYTQHNVNYYVISADTMEILCVDAGPAEARRVGAVYLGLPETARVRVGEELSFINLPYQPETDSPELVTYEPETEEPAIEHAYVYTFVETLMSSPLAPRVTGMELGDRFDIWFVLDHSIKVRVGGMEELERKLTFTERSLREQEEKGFDANGLPTLVDVSDPARIIHRTSPDIDMPDWAKGLA